MTDEDLKATLHHYLQEGRDALLLKLEGLSEYDLRRPLVPTGTNLLGLVKHTAATEAGYFGSVMGRPFEDEPFWWEADDPAIDANADMFAAPDETPEQIIDLYRRVQAHSDATIQALPLDAVGTVPWWRSPDATLFKLLVHMINETARHAGHADIVRELIDGTAGRSPGVSNLPDLTTDDWSAHRDHLQAIAEAGRKTP